MPRPISPFKNARKRAERFSALCQRMHYIPAPRAKEVVDELLTTLLGAGTELIATRQSAEKTQITLAEQDLKIIAIADLIAHHKRRANAAGNTAAAAALNDTEAALRTCVHYRNPYEIIDGAPLRRDTREFMEAITRPNNTRRQLRQAHDPERQPKKRMSERLFKEEPSDISNQKH